MHANMISLGIAGGEGDVIMRNKQELTTLTFGGPSFEDQGLELDVLSELVQYKKILVETAEELWRRNHPYRERLPRGFREAIRIKFYDLCKGSIAVPLYREFELEGDQALFNFKLDDELDQAVILIEAGIESAQEDRPLPEDFPKNVLPLFESLGKSLGESDFIQVKSPKSEQPAKFTHEVRERLINFKDRAYEDNVALTGEVRSADLDGLNFTIRLDDGAKIHGKFEPEQEQEIIEALKDHNTRRLKITGLGQFTHRDATIKKIFRVDKVEVKPVGANGFEKEAKPVWEIIAGISAQVPEEEWAEVPTDLSKEVDHYLYGTPRSEK